MRILGIDPGTRACGYGVIECSGGEPHMVDYGVLQSREASVSARLKTIYDGLVEVIERLGPDVAAVETAFFGKNVRSALRIGEGRGVALLAAASLRLAVAEYSPAQVKKAVVGTGQADKSQVQQMVGALLHITAEEIPEDAADALAIAICHSHRMAVEEL